MTDIINNIINNNYIQYKNLKNINYTLNKPKYYGKYGNIYIYNNNIIKIIKKNKLKDILDEYCIQLIIDMKRKKICPELYDIIKINNKYAIHMEIINGYTLDKYHYINDSIFIDIFDKLYYLQENLSFIHGDFKPNNIMLDNNDNIYFIDFGLSSLRYNNNFIRTYNFVIDEYELDISLYPNLKAFDVLILLTACYITNNTNYNIKNYYKNNSIIDIDELYNNFSNFNLIFVLFRIICINVNGIFDIKLKDVKCVIHKNNNNILISNINKRLSNISLNINYNNIEMYFPNNILYHLLNSVEH